MQFLNHIIKIFHIGQLPSSLCSIGVLTYFHISDSGNTGLTCTPQCLTTVSNRYIPATYCPNFQDDGLCSFIASTNIITISGYSQWICTTDKITSTNPCSPVWPSVTCSGGYVHSISILNKGITGTLLLYFNFI